MKLSLALQAALLDRLRADPALADALGGPHVHDAPPHAAREDAPDTWLVIGDETVSAWSSRTTDGAEHEIVLSLWTALRGYAPLKRAMAALHDALDDAALPLDGGAVVSMRFLSARTAREARGRLRRADCRFRLLVEHAPES